MDEEIIMRALNSLIISMFLLGNGLGITGLTVAHSAPCPAEGTYASIKIWHYWESTQGDPFYTQTTEDIGTVGIFFGFRGRGGDFTIERTGDGIISRTVDAKLTSPYWNCTYETAQAKVTVEVSSNLTTCTDGILYMHIVEKVEETSVDYHCVDAQGNIYGPFPQVYPETTLEHDVLLEYVPGAMDVQAVPIGHGSYQWTLLFQKIPDMNIVPLVSPLLLSE